jgi:septal ring factor EnvC (AmiA/AmiB activator)
MIFGNTREEVLDFLMWSDFEEGLSREEFKFLLKRMQFHLKEEKLKREGLRRVLEEKENEIEKLKMIAIEKEQHSQRCNQRLSQVEDDLENLRERRLTLGERIFGKIKTKS